jgi:hypothetical protein
LNFHLNPKGSVGAYLGTKYDVSVSPDYTINPTEGTYGINTFFILKKNIGAPTGNVTLSLSDKTNTNCTVSVVVPEPKCISCTNTPYLEFINQSGTCTASNPNNDAKVVFSNIVNSDKVGISEGVIYIGTTYASTASTVNTGNLTFNGLKHNTNYTFRFFDQQDLCYKDTTIKTLNKICCTLSLLGVITEPSCSNNDGAIALILSGNSNAATFQWSNNATSQDLSNLSAGTYTVNVFDNGCMASETFELNVQVSNIIVSFCQGETFDLFVSDPMITNIQWLKDGIPISGENGLLYTASQAGIYSYTSNGIGGCSVGQCCPIELKLKTDCCKPVICTGVKITRKN